jgi:hypothetical protein
MSASFDNRPIKTMLDHKSSSEVAPARAKKVLLVVHVNTFFTELGQLAKLLLADSAFQPELMFYPSSTAARDARQVRKIGVTCIDQFGDNFPDAAQVPYPIHIARTAFRRLQSLLRRFPPYDFVYEVISLKRRRGQIERILRHRAIGFVALGGDMTGYDTAAFIDACHRLNIRVAIVPSTMSNGLEQAEVYSADPRHGLNSWFNRYVAKRHPKWLYFHHGRPVMRERGARALALEWLDLAPPLPWIFNSGNADAVTVESEAMRDYYLSAGLPRERLVVTGSPSDDAIASVLLDAQARKHQLLLKLGLPADRPLLVTALPPDSLYMIGGRPQCEFKTYSDLVGFWIGSVGATPGFNKIICLHPSVDPESMRFLETPEMRIAPDRTAELIPLCDLYVASVSSTIRWAIACGKPVINYDVYRYRYTDYLGLKGVLTIEEQDQFLDLLRRMATDSVFRNEIAELQKADAPQWGNLDGKAGERTIALFRQLIG